MKRLSRKDTLLARQFALDIISFWRSILNDKYRFAERLVGSAKWNTVIKDDDGFWEVDYQLLFTKNSKEYKSNGLKYATDIKNDFFDSLDKRYKENRDYIVQNSTTAITLINKKDKFSVDFVLIRLFPENHEIIRRNNKKETNSTNEFCWNELPKYKEAYKNFRKLKGTEKVELIENYILPRKVKEKKKDDNDITKKSSSKVFVEEVNNYVVRRRNH